jgi:hypothetical protein
VCTVEKLEVKSHHGAKDNESLVRRSSDKLPSANARMKVAHS